MARIFNGTSDCAQASIDLSAFSVISISCWLFWNSFANDNDLCLELTTTTNTNGAFTIIPNDANGVFAVYIGRVGGSWGDRFPRPSPAVWHHYLFEMDRGGTTENRVWVDGISQTLTAGTHTSQSGTLFANSTLNIMARNAGSLFGAGRMADLAIWGGGALGQAGATYLAGGGDPVNYPPASIIGWWPLGGSASPEPNAYGTAGNATLTGTTGGSDPVAQPPIPMAQGTLIQASPGQSGRTSGGVAW